MTDYKAIRHQLHEHPQTAGNEQFAHDYIIQYLQSLHPDKVYTHVGGYGVVAVWGKDPGKETIAFRADTDALPIGHRCGHDGHTTILLRLAELVDSVAGGSNKLLLWQPAEETGTGSRAVLESGILQQYNIKAFYALHNLPGYPLGTVVLCPRTFAAASTGVVYHLDGRETHASTPEMGVNPGLAVSEIINRFNGFNGRNGEFRQSTLICVRVGSPAFGTSAGHGEVMFTLRAFTNDEMERLMSSELFTEDMLNYVDQYVEYCTNEYMEALAHEKQASMFVEQKLDLTEFIPEGFGTADCCVISDDVLEVIDFKYGMGVPVYADWNSQLMLYGLGALQIFSGIYDIKEVLLTIVQPRIDNISSFQISVDELNKWVLDELKPKARMAWNGEGELLPGDWCKFCTVKTRCRALYEEQIKIAKADFAEDPRMLSDEDIADIVRRAPSFTSWVNSITEYAQNQAVNEGKQWPGLKLVEGRSVRKWIDPDLAEKTIRERCPEIPNDVLYTTKLSSLTTIERAVGKKEFSTLFADIVVKPAGTPTLVPEDDKRPAIGIQQAVKDFQ